MNQKNCEFKQISYPEYIILFTGCRTALSDYYAKATLGENGKIYCLLEDNFPASFLILGYEASGAVIQFVETVTSRRNKGYAKLLTEYVVSRLNVPYIIQIMTTEKFYEQVCHIAEKTGFEAHAVSTVYTVATDERMWKHMEEIRMSRMSRLMMPKGGSCIPFANLSESQLHSLYCSPKTEFNNSFSPYTFFHNVNKGLDKNLSFGLMKGDELLAYSLISRPKPGYVIVEQIATMFDKIGSGIIICPLYATMSEIRKNPDIETMSLTIYDNNTDSLNFSLKILEGLDIKEKKNIVYKKEILPASCKIPNDS